MQLSTDSVDVKFREGAAGECAVPWSALAGSVAAGHQPADKARKAALTAVLTRGLPTLPAYVFELNGLLSESPVNLRQVIEVVRTDPSLTAQLLRLCNSALMGFHERVTRIE